MTSQSPHASGDAPLRQFPIFLTAKEASRLLKVSVSYLAKARMRGDGPPYILIGRAVRYAEAALLQWMKSRQRMSTSESWR